MKRVAFLLLVLVGGLSNLKAQDSVATYLETEILVDRLTIPWDMVWGPDNKIWFSQRDGGIFRLDPDTKELEKIFQIPDVFQSWDNSGTHACVLHPKFPIIPYLFVNYNDGEFGAKLVRYTYSVNSNTLIDPIVILDKIPGSTSHNGSRIEFDEEGYLYFCTGDAFVTDQIPQNLESVGGKVLKMDIDGNPAPDNPFGNLVWTLGHRNPQGLVFSDDGMLYSAEHGAATDDELNLIERGRNYGWPEVQGYCDQPSEMGFCNDANVREPLTVWTPTEAPCGLAYFNEPSIPEWEHTLLLCFLKAKQLKVMHLSPDGQSIVKETPYFEQPGGFGRLRDVLVAPNGRLFVCTSNQETNGQSVVQADDDKIIEIINPNYTYPEIPTFSFDVNADVYPIPTNNVLNVLVSQEASSGLYNIYDVKGRLVAHKENQAIVLAGVLVIDIGEMPNGTYFLEVVTDRGQVINRKVVKVD